MKFHVFLTPMHVVEIDCETHDQVSGVHRFSKGDQVIAEFSNSIGWLQVLSDPKEKATVSPLTLVSTNIPRPPDPAA